VSAYAELHCVSNFTFLRGASHPSELVQQAHELKYRALALTDECSMAGVVRAHDAAKKFGLKLIVGSEFHTTDDLHIVLLAPTQKAYAQICELITTGRRNAEKGSYKLSRSTFEKVDLDECLALWLPTTQPRASLAGWVRDLFPQRCWIAVELHRQPDDTQRLAQLRQLGKSLSIPLVAAGDVHMHAREQRPLQDTLTAIRHKCTIEQAGHRLFPNGERHLRTLGDLATVYPHDLLEESVRIAECCQFSLGSLKYRYPRELVPAGVTATEHLRALTEEGLKWRWPNGVSMKVRETVEKELKLIAELGYEHFFLTVHEIVDYARKLDPPILCQGRGSAANSVVCYALRITEVNPDKANLLFERFLSKERGEPPDIDVDFEHERREEVIQHVFKKYGRHRTALAATVITYKARSAIRDVGKALGMDADVVDRIAKSHVWWDDATTFCKNLADLGVQVSTDVAKRFCTLVLLLQNFPRHLSQHVGGFVISEEPISELVPVENAAMEDRTVIQWDKTDLESLGLLKVDVLALGMLTAMRRTFALIAKTGGTHTAMDQIPDKDEQTYDMICAADTVGVFQIESRAQMSMLPRLRPRDYYDLVIEVAIVRPGPIKGGMVHPYLAARKLRPEEVPYPKEALRPILEKTHGVPIFQEQVMQIAIVAAGFTPGQADELRRAMGAWQRSGNMGDYKEKLMRGMRERDYSEEFAERIFKQIEGFGEYGFPESHAASFALLTYQSSYLKCHYPAAFFAGLINSQPMGFYQPSQLLEQAKRQGVEIRPIDVTASDWDCTLEPMRKETASGNSPYDRKCAIRLGMRLVRGVREPEAQRIVAERTSRRFVGVEDVAARAGLTQRTTRALAMCGAFRTLTVHRNAAFWNALGVERLPGMLAKVTTADEEVSLPAPTEWEEVQRDYRQLRLSTGRHPLALLRPALRKMGLVRRKDLNSLASGRIVRVGGLVTHLQHPQTAKGVIFASLEDETGINNIIFWPGVFADYRHRILQARLMIVEGELQSQEGVINVVARSVEDFSHWVRALPRNSRDFH
jgi:error-prone DNA polymerase